MKIGAQDHKHVGRLIAQEFPGKPLGIIILVHAAVVVDADAGMGCFKGLNGLVDDGKAVGIGHVPIAAGEHTEFQHHFPFPTGVGNAAGHGGQHRRPQQHADPFSFHPLPPQSRFR